MSEFCLLPAASPGIPDLFPSVHIPCPHPQAHEANLHSMSPAASPDWQPSGSCAGLLWEGEGHVPPSLKHSHLQPTSKLTPPTPAASLSPAEACPRMTYPVSPVLSRASENFDFKNDKMSSFSAPWTTAS